MEDPVYTSLAPRSLVMTRDSCFYCGAGNPGFVEIKHLFGMKACDLHMAVANRDCRAYLHKEKMVIFDDAYKHNILGELLNMIKTTTFPVLRSSGELQEGWMLNEVKFDMDTMITYNVSDGEWMIPAKLVKEGAAILTKYIPIVNLKMANKFPVDLIDKAVFCLIDGIYSKEFEEVEVLGGAGVLPNEPSSIEVEYEGRIVRVVVPPVAVAVAVAVVVAVDIADNPC